MKKLDVPHRAHEAGPLRERAAQAGAHARTQAQARPHDRARADRSALLRALPAAGEALPEQVRELYEQLERSEARHFEMYLDFAQREFEAAEIAARLELIAAREAELATSPTASCASTPARLTNGDIPISERNEDMSPFSARQRHFAYAVCVHRHAARRLVPAARAPRVRQSRHRPRTGVRPGGACGRESAGARRWRARRAAPPRDSRP